MTIIHVTVPPDIEHALIWTKLPVLPNDLPESVKPRIHQDGLWGFTGSTSPPPSPSLLPTYLPALSDWGVTMDKLIRSPKGTEEEEQLVRAACKEIETFIERRWTEREWETAWFVNPPVGHWLQCCHSMFTDAPPVSLASTKRPRSCPHTRLRETQITGRNRRLGVDLNGL